jgi:hypothetical protein
MKKILIAGLLIVMASGAYASDFGLVKLSAPQTSAGTFISMSKDTSAAGATLTIITHKAIPSNNILSSLISGWAPLTLGGTIGSGLGGPSIAGGTGINLLPASQASLLGLLKLLSEDGSLTTLKNALTAKPAGGATSLFIGPQYNLVFETLRKCHTEPTWFIGANITWE